MGYNAAAELNNRVLENIEKLAANNQAQIAAGFLSMRLKQMKKPSITTSQINYRADEEE